MARRSAAGSERIDHERAPNWMQPAIDAALARGFAGAGVCSLGPSRHADFFDRWLAEGRHAEMHYLAEHRQVRLDPRWLIESDGQPLARSALMVVDAYARRGDAVAEPGRDPAEPPAAGACAEDPVPGRIARYARGLDYHKVMKRRLHAVCDELREQHPDERFRAFVDTAPVFERELAVRAGLGWQGKHTLLIHPRWGSWFFLGGIATTLEPADDAGPSPVSTEITDRCGSCTRCIDACPTRAIGPYTVDASRCISYLTIERRSPGPPDDPTLARATGDWLFGCDICQEVCPYNSPRDPAWLETSTPRPNDAYHAAATPPAARTHRLGSGDYLDAREVSGWTEDRRREALAGSAMKRARLEQWHRNALVVLANADADERSR